MRILLTGRNGQLGWELERALASLGDVIATDRATLDLMDPDAIRRVVREMKPELIVNAAAYTAVDRAESEPEAALRVNGAAPGVFAEEAKWLGALLVHYSTDYVFDGAKATPYVEEDPPHPLNVYGASKLQGEQAIQASGCRYLLLRTSWVYSARGTNFLRTILRRAREQPELRVVGDQRGSPTAACDIANATAAMLAGGRAPTGMYHLSAAGNASWYEFACEIFRVTSGPRVRVREILTNEYPTPARRPHYSVLSNDRIKRALSISLPDWRESLLAVCRTLD